LEFGFQRILTLRLTLKLDQSDWKWCALGLPYVDSIVQCPKLNGSVYLLPKFTKKAKGNVSQVNSYMEWTHNGSTADVSRKVFNVGLLPNFAALLKPGAYYYHDFKSSSADGKILGDAKKLFCFQFKNLAEPIKRDKIIEEVEKCNIPGYEVYLIILCTAGFQPSDCTFKEKVL